MPQGQIGQIPLQIGRREDLAESADETVLRRPVHHQTQEEEVARGSSSLFKRCGITRKNNSNLRVLTGRGIDLDRSAMLFDYDVVTDGQAKTGPLPSRFG